MWRAAAPTDATVEGTNADKRNALSADAIIEQRGLKQISDESALERIVDEVLAANPAIVAEYRAGREKAFNSLVGKAMQATRGKANPAQVNAILKRKV
jgi:aspartyl-tRNA(Asn)/glutamyl-tRNA(Gln) amidotransferase subunit B